MTATIAPDLIQDCLVEDEEISKVLKICDDNGIDYLEGFIAAIGLDFEDQRMDPLRLLYTILGTDGEMSSRESITLLHNTINNLFICIEEQDS